MGIQNLLRELKPITNEHAHLSMLEGQKAGVDASCWLHRAAISCCLELMLNKKTTRYLGWIKKAIRTLERYKITPIIVFDGDKLPMKANEEHKRSIIRDEAKKKAMKAHQEGNKSEAYRLAMGSVRINKHMITEFIKYCKKNGIKFVCAPYEADAQLGYMYKQGEIDFVITRDSDLVLFGVKKAWYKFDPNGHGHFLDLTKIPNYTPPQMQDNGPGNGKRKSKKKHNKKMDLCYYLKRHNTLKDLINVCVLSGCDYAESLPGIGLKTAVKHCTEFSRLDRMIHTLMANVPNKKKKLVPKDYKIQFKRAVLTFLHQTVYDTKTKKLTNLNPMDEKTKQEYLAELGKTLNRMSNSTFAKTFADNGKNPSVYDMTFQFLGPKINDQMATEIATGLRDARSKKMRGIDFDGHINDNQNNHNNNDWNANQDDDIRRNGNRFFAPSSTQNQPRSPQRSNVFKSIHSNTNNIQNSISKPRNRRKQKQEKYFGTIDNTNNEIPNDNCLDEFLTQFGIATQNNHSQPVDGNVNDNWQSTEDTCSLPLDTPFDEEKEMDQNMNNSGAIIVPNSDSEEEAQINVSHNKPLKRPNRNRNRKRKRNEICQEYQYKEEQEQEKEHLPLSTNINLDNISPILSNKCHPKSKRKLNNGSIQVNKHKHRQNHHATTPKQPKAKSPTPGLFTDLLNSSNNKGRSKRKRRSKGTDIDNDDKENISRNTRRSNPFSKNRKNHTVPRRSLAMIGAQDRPINISDNSDSDNDSVQEQEDSEVQFVAMKKTPKQKSKKRMRAHSFLSYSQLPNEDEDDDEINNNMSDTNRNNRKICEVISDDEDENNDNNDNDEDLKLYSQLSQSQSERQIVDVLSQFKFQQNKNDDEEVKEQRSEDDEDDDIQIISKPPSSEKKTASPSPIVTKKKKNIKPQKYTPKAFKPPRFKNGTSPQYSTSGKKKKKIESNKKKVTKNVKSKSKSRKFKPPRQKKDKISKNQMKLTAFFSKK